MKKLLTIIAVILVLVIAAALIAPQFISANTFKGQILSQVEKATGRKLTIDGELKLSFFPTIGLSAKQVSLANPPGFGNEPFMTIASLDVNVALMPLLNKQIEVKSLSLDQPKVNLRVNKGGSNNWQFVKKTAAEAKDNPAKDTTSPGAVDGFVLSKLEITDGKLNYIDDLSQKFSELSKLNATLSMASSSPLEFKTDAVWNGKAVKVSAEMSSLDGFLNRKKTDITLSVASDDVKLNSKGVYAEGNYSGEGSLSSPSIKNLLAWTNQTKMDTPATLALDSKADVKCAQQQCTFSNAALSIDKLQGKGTIRVNASGNRPAIDLTLTTGVLDINPFLAPEQQAQISILVSNAFAADSTWSTAPIDFSGLQAVNLNADIKTDGLIYRNITLGKAPLKAALQNGKLEALISDAPMYMGRGSVGVTLDGNGVPSIGVRANLQNIQLEPLLKDLAGFNRVTGTLTTQINAGGRGRSQREIISTLEGGGTFKASDGTFKGINMADMARNVQAAFLKSDTAGQNTHFSELTGSYIINSGIISNRDLAMKAEGMNLSGQGNINLPNYTIYYRLVPQLVSNAKAADGTVTQKQGIAVPILVEGSLDHPSFKADVGSLVQEAIQDPSKLKEQFKNTRGDLKDQFKDTREQIKDIKGLFKDLKGR